MTVQLDLPALRGIAEKATPGEWSETYAHSRTIEADDGTIVVDALNDGIGAGVVNPEDAEHIATFDPPTVLALLDEIERWRAAHDAEVRAATLPVEQGGE